MVFVGQRELAWCGGHGLQGAGIHSPNLGGIKASAFPLPAPLPLSAPQPFYLAMSVNH